MIIDLHSHFFPVAALQNPGKYEHRAPKITLDQGKLSVTSQIGMRAGLGAGAYDPVARIKALDEMGIDMQAISPSPILLFYWEEPEVAAHFSRKQNEAIQASTLCRRWIYCCSCIRSRAELTPTILSPQSSATFCSLLFARH
jgi:hypothetical protein